MRKWDSSSAFPAVEPLGIRDKYGGLERSHYCDKWLRCVTSPLYHETWRNLHFSPFPSGSTTGKANISSCLRVCLLTTSFLHLRSWWLCLFQSEPISQQFNGRDWTHLQHTRHWFKQSLQCVSADFPTCTGSQSFLQQPVNSQQLNCREDTRHCHYLPFNSR